MYFNKFPYAANFEFIQDAQFMDDDDDSGRTIICGITDGDPAIGTVSPHTVQTGLEAVCRKYTGDIYHLQIDSQRWDKNHAQYDLTFPAAAKHDDGDTVLEIDAAFAIKLSDRDGKTLLRGFPGQTFGVCGCASIFQFERESHDMFYGMGEKMFDMERSAVSTKFWNTDAMGDFAHCVCKHGRPDPYYVSVPYLIVRRGDAYIGLLLDNPCATFMSTCSKVSIEGFMETETPKKDMITMGAEQGQPNLIFIYGPSLAELTRKFQKLVGVTPLPPAWALGYHQCRWGYESHSQLKNLDAKMTEHEIPCDGLWLDIDYMNGFRVFTFDETKNFPDPQENIADLQSSGRRVVPIIDPGVKFDPGYSVYDSGHAADVFCKNSQGREYIGIVWPGETVFPDFSTESGRAWWAEHVTKFANTGIRAAWLDMNDPATGPVLCTGMRFNNGRESHHTFHNQYAMAMARATRDGLENAFPEERVFLLSRSGCTGSGKYAAVWTGDNVSNYHYLKSSIPCSVNLALSGIPFNGPDIGGFAGNTNAPLLADWIKAGFLFPFCRNHTGINSQDQEPWAFGEKTLDVMRHYIQLRYKLRPYLYNLFIAQAANGDAILRPLFYDFEETKELPLGRINDQFMVGAEIMQAPFVEENAKKRSVTLPDDRWYAVHRAEWVEGNRAVTEEKEELTTPLYFRDGAIIPMATTDGGDFSFTPENVIFHIVVDHQTAAIRDCVYAFDDGISHEYKNGARSRLRVKAARSGNRLDIITETIEDGYGKCNAGFALYAVFDNVTVNGVTVKPKPVSLTMAGAKQSLYYLV